MGLKFGSNTVTKLMAPGENLFNVNDKDTSANHWSENITAVDSDGWITIDRDNSSGTSRVYDNYWTHISPELKPDTDYLIVTEVAEASGTVIASIGADSPTNTSQFEHTVVSYTKPGVYTQIAHTFADFTGKVTMLRGYIYTSAGATAHAKFRIAVYANTSRAIAYEPYHDPEVKRVYLGTQLVYDKDS